MRPALILLRLLLMSIVVAGCTTAGPDFVRPNMPAIESYAANDELAPADLEVTADPIVDWWRIFGSEKLNDAVTEALSGNRSLKAVSASLTRALYQARAAGAVLDPSVDLSAGLSRERINLAAFGFNVRSPVINLYQVGALVSYDLDLFGANHRQIEQTGAQVEQQAYQAAAATLTLTGDIALEAITVATLNEEIAMVEQIVACDRAMADLNLRAQSVGAAATNEQVAFDAQEARDRALLPGLRQELAVARHAVTLLAGAQPMQHAEPDFTLADFHQPDHLPIVLPATLVRQRPDILAAEAAQHAASAAIGVAVARQYPDITLSANLAQEAISPDRLFGVPATGANVGGSLVAPLFHAGALQAEKAAAEAEYRASEARYQQTVLKAFNQVADAFQALAHDAEEAKALKKSLDLAEASRQLTLRSQSVGAAGKFAILAAERDVYLARRNLARSQGRRLADSVQLLLAAGGSVATPGPNDGN